MKFVKSRTWNGFKCNFLPVFVGIFVLFVCLFDGFHISWSRSNSDNQKCKANYEFHFKFSDLNVRRQKTLLSWDILICNRFFHNILYCWTFAFHYANFFWNFDRISSGFHFQSTFFFYSFSLFSINKIIEFDLKFMTHNFRSTNGFESNLLKFKDQTKRTVSPYTSYWIYSAKRRLEYLEQQVWLGTD